MLWLKLFLLPVAWTLQIGHIWWVSVDRIIYADYWHHRLVWRVEEKLKSWFYAIFGFMPFRIMHPLSPFFLDAFDKNNFILNPWSLDPSHSETTILSVDLPVVNSHKFRWNYQDKSGKWHFLRSERYFCIFFLGTSMSCTIIGGTPLWLVSPCRNFKTKYHRGRAITLSRPNFNQPFVQTACSHLRGGVAKPKIPCTPMMICLQ